MSVLLPDPASVYLHCSSIFKGPNAEIRRPKKILKLLSQHRNSIEILTNEFPLGVIAMVAKELLDERIFESLHLAKLIFPELFQTSEKQDAERAASEADTAKTEAEAVREVTARSEAEWEDEAAPAEGIPDEDEVFDCHAETADGAAQDVERLQPGLPRLHPVSLPFKTQHHILTRLQSVLEECCFQFGNLWLPEWMQRRKWQEPESVELTQWIQKFSKHAKSLPRAATTLSVRKGLIEVLSATNCIRHSAVHRLPISAAGILKMVDAAIAFAEALKDKERATHIESIRTQLATAIEDIEQHQNLLERKLCEQMKDFARRRAEIDELERVAVEEMLVNDKKHRMVACSSVEGFLHGMEKSQAACNDCDEDANGNQEIDAPPEEPVAAVEYGMFLLLSVAFDSRRLPRSVANS
jgi:hypothetical protein